MVWWCTHFKLNDTYLLTSVTSVIFQLGQLGQSYGLGTPLYNECTKHIICRFGLTLSGLLGDGMLHIQSTESVITTELLNGDDLDII